MKQDQEYQLLQKYLLEPHTGTAFKIKTGQTLRIIDIQGQQVVDLVS